jgi:hypothetical protein
MERKSVYEIEDTKGTLPKKKSTAGKREIES